MAVQLKRVSSGECVWLGMFLSCPGNYKLTIRLMAISTADAKLDMEVWKRVLDLDQRLETRLQPST
jgi:hypothetical protein